jgi:hypothetical protein
MKPYISGGFIKETAVRSAFENACRSNKLVAENGITDVRHTMTVAFAQSRDQLPDLSKLEDRPLAAKERRGFRSWPVAASEGRLPDPSCGL